MLINLRNALMAGTRLPYDAEVEFLESTGTQWIDTGIIGNERLVIDLIWSYGATDADTPPFGSRLSASSRAIAITGYNLTIDRRLYLNYGSKSNYVSYNGNDLYGHIWEIHVENGNSRLIRDGLVVSTGSASTTAFTTPAPLMLFGLYDNGTMYVSKNMRIHSWSVRDGSTLIQDLIPVRVSTVGYLYDRVSGKLFGNAGTGDFALGQDVVPVEYLQSSGTQYIDTGYIPNHQTRWELDYQFTSIGSGLNGMFQDNPTIRFNLGQGTDGFFNISYGANNALNIASDTLRHLFVMDIANLQWRLDSSSGAFPGAVTNTLQNSLRIFCRNSTGGRAFNLHSGRCFASRMYQSGALSQELLSVRVGTEGAMMDVLTRKVYRNAGTGAFTYGNDLKYPIPAE